MLKAENNRLHKEKAASFDAAACFIDRIKVNLPYPVQQQLHLP